jgi:hypothetical protein
VTPKSLRSNIHPVPTCNRHPTNVTIGLCKECSEWVCAECGIEEGLKIYCKECHDIFVKRIIPEGVNLSWINRHLIWSLVIAYSFIFIITALFGGFGVNIYVFYVIATGGIGIWYLHRKSQSILYMLVLYLPWLGLAIFLGLENKRHRQICYEENGRQFYRIIEVKKR